jgi:hypothetical protein
MLPWRLRLVGFGGTGEVASSGDGFRTDQFLPPEAPVDFAWGKDNFTWSMGVGEAFSLWPRATVPGVALGVPPNSSSAFRD